MAINDLANSFLNLLAEETDSAEVEEPFKDDEEKEEEEEDKDDEDDEEEDEDDDEEDSNY